MQLMEEEERILAGQALGMDVAARMMVAVFKGTERSRLKELTFRKESNQCCASGSGRIRNYLQVRIRIRN
jgi:hypothetical protein